MGHGSNYTASPRGCLLDVRFFGTVKVLLPAVCRGYPTPSRRGVFALSATFPKYPQTGPPESNRENLPADQPRLDRNTDIPRFNPGYRAAGSSPHRKNANRKPVGSSRTSKRHILDVNRLDFQASPSGCRNHSAKRAAQLRAGTCKQSGATTADNVGDKASVESTPIR